MGTTGQLGLLALAGHSSQLAPDIPLDESPDNRHSTGIRIETTARLGATLRATLWTPSGAVTVGLILINNGY